MGLTKEQELAITAKDVSVAVSAAAGSGKTSVLTKRIIKRVCDDGGKISRILAVTFTEAAAAEILERVSRAISDKLAENPSDKHIARQSLLVNSAKISTVHTFCYGLVRENFEDIGLPSDISVADSAWLDSQKKKIMLSVIDDYFDGKIRGELGIDDFASLADTFSERSNTDEFCENALKIYEDLSTEPEFIGALDKYIQMYNNIASGNFGDSVFAKELLGMIVSTARSYERVFNEAENYVKSVEDYKSTVDRYEYSAENAKKLAELTSFDHKTIQTLLESYAPANMPSVSKAIQSDKYQFYANKRTEYKKFTEHLKSSFFSFTQDDINAAAIYSAKVFGDLKNLLSEFDKRFKAEKLCRHVISFSDMEHYALDILWDRENDAPTKAALSIRENYDEVFIDEYQDTNEVQNKIFSMICKDNNKFCVGDVKQSIYSFRGAAPYIFTEMLDSRPKYEDGATEPSKIFLSKNFRSNESVIDFCNTVFDTLMNVGKEGYGADERLVRGLEENPDGQTEKDAQTKDAEKVEIGIFGKDDETSEQEYIAKRISELISSGCKHSDIAVLVRNNSQVQPIADALAKYNIPYVNPDDKEFFKSPEVLLALSLLTVIDNPAKDVYLAATLKSRIYGVTLDKLLEIRAYAPGSLYDALCAYVKDNGEFKEGKRFLADLDKFRAIAENASCESIIKQVYLHTDMISLVCADCADDYEAERRKFNLIQLYNYARGFGGDSYRGLFDFIEFVENVIEGKAEFNTAQLTPSGDTVKIMTVHKSKGLEFKTCFLFGAQKDLIQMKGYSKNIIMCADMPVVKMMHPSRLGRSATLFSNIAVYKYKADSINEGLRVLYVALTRAKEKLIITATTSSRSGKIDFSENSSLCGERDSICPYSLISYKSFIRLINLAVAGTDVYRDLTPVDDTQSSRPETAATDKFTEIEAKEIVEKRLSFEYPFKDISHIPSKMSVSKLYPGLIDENDAEFTDAENGDDSVSCVPRFLSEADEQTTAAERGTATHTFMQFFDFDRVEKHGVDEEIRYLADKGFIFMSDMQKIDKKKLEKFFGSDLAKKMRSAKKIYREKRFMMSFPAEEFTLDETLKSKVTNEKLLVQGVIDCAYEDDDGKIVLIDYKTDHFKYGTPRDEIIKTLKERHTRQLTYYKRACECLFGEVSHVYVYSFALDGTVEI